MGCFTSKQQQIAKAQTYLQNHDRINPCDLSLWEFHKYESAKETLAKYNIPIKRRNRKRCVGKKLQPFDFNQNFNK